MNNNCLICIKVIKAEPAISMILFFSVIIVGYFDQVSRIWTTHSLQIFFLFYQILQIVVANFFECFIVHSTLTI